MSLFTGQSLGRYRILEQLGQGGMAVVYKAHDTLLERDVALKVIRTDQFTPASLGLVLQRFEREAKALARLNHPNIISVVDYGKQEDLPYLVMIYQPGGTLKSRLGRPLPWQEALGLVLPIARALAYAHGQGIIHRDVKPSNILITATGEPLLTDFGIAKLLESGDGQTLTGSGAGIGTPEYMAPEQGLGRSVDARADIYSLGIVLYELLTGRKPFTADTPMAVVLKHVTEPLPSPRRYAPGLPEALEQILGKALAKDPSGRPASMQSWLEDLEAFAGRKTPPRQTSAPFPKQASAPDSQTLDFPAARFPAWLPWAGAALLGAGLLLLGGAWVGRSLPALLPSAVPTASAEVTPPTLTPAARLETATLPAATLPPTASPGATLHPSLTPTLGVVEIRTRSQDGMEMVLVPAGPFEMGLEGGTGNAAPVHMVLLDAFWIDRNEVPNGLYAACVRARACSPPRDRSAYDDPAFEAHPVVYVTWQQAGEYCTWVSARLPSEAEWEKAARGTDGRTFPWGEQDPDCSLANYSGCVENTNVVGSYPAGMSPYGAFDLAGNVWEWVADYYDAGYYAVSPAENPAGPQTGSLRVIRGSSWYWNNTDLRSGYRLGYRPENSFLHLGFRCARNLAWP